MTKKSNTGNQGFKKPIIRELMLRANLRCSNPNCRRLTAAFCKSKNKIEYIGEAAHIRANSEGGPRYEEGYDASRIENGIWLCPTCHTLVDKKESLSIYTVEKLEEWKELAETSNYHYLENTRQDLIDYFASLNTRSSRFSFSEASDMESLLVLYCLLSGKGCTIQTYIDDSDSFEFFMDFYCKFYTWYRANKKINKMFNSVKLPSPQTVLSRPFKANAVLFSMFAEAANGDALADYVIVNNGYTQIDYEELCDSIFDSIEEAERFFEFWNK